MGIPHKTAIDLSGSVSLTKNSKLAPENQTSGYQANTVSIETNKKAVYSAIRHHLHLQKKDTHHVLVAFHYYALIP